MHGFLIKTEEALSLATKNTMEFLEVVGGLFTDYNSMMRQAISEQSWVFNKLTEEVTRQRELGIITAMDEAEIWNKTADIVLLGSQNHWQARLNAQKAMFEASCEWIEQESRLGKLSAQEVADAWQKVYEETENINYKMAAFFTGREASLAAADEETAARRTDSDRWMAFQDTIDGGDGLRQVADYERRIQSEKELLRQIESGVLNGVVLGEAEQDQRWKETMMKIEDLKDAQLKSAKAYMEEQYALSREYAKKQIEDYYDQSRQMLDADYQRQEQSYKAQLEKLSNTYLADEAEAEIDERNEEIAELRRLQRYYSQAVTHEGQERYKQITEEIEKLEKENEQERNRLIYNEEKAAIEKKLSEAQRTYQENLTALDEQREQMVTRAELAAEESVRKAALANSTLAGVITENEKAFIESTDLLFSEAQRAIDQYITGIGQSFAKLGFSSQISTGGNYVLNFNDYGEKIVSDDRAVENYGNNIIAVFQNYLRSKGAK